MDFFSILMPLGALALFAWLIYSVRALRGEVHDLLVAFKSAHANGYPDPSAAAVVTDGRESSSAQPTSPEPALARAALPSSRLDVGNRETPEEEEPPASGDRGFVVERVSLDEEELAYLDELAAERGMTRDELISVLLKSGLPILERPRKKK